MGFFRKGINAVNVNNLASGSYEFGDFRLIPDEHLLLCCGEPVALSPKVFEILVCLVESEGHLVKKSDLLDQLWPGSFIEEATLARAVSSLRKVLGETAENKLIETVPKHGYRFVATVKESRGDDEKPASHFFSVEEKSEPQIKLNGNLAPDQSETFWKKRTLVPAMVGSAVIALLVVAYFWFLKPETQNQPAAVQEIKSIAVLPFRTIDSDDENKFLSIGMADAVINKLSNIKSVVVRQTSAVMRYSGIPTDANQVGRELEVDALLEGSIQKSEGRIRVTVQLVRVSDGAALWADSFDDLDTGIFTLQDSISEQVVRSLALQLTGEERTRVKRRHTENLEAYQEYQRGRFFWNKRSYDGLRRAIEHFNRAVEIDPEYALAYAGLAETYVLINLYSPTQDPTAFPNARKASERALQLDHELAEAYAALGLVNTQYEYNWDAAETAYLRAISLNPNYATARQWYGEFLSFRNRTDEAIVQLEKAIELDPTSPSTNTALAWPYLVANQPDKALEIIDRVLEMDDSFPMALTYKARALVQKKEYDEAIAVYHKAIAATDGSAFNTASLGYAYAVSGREAKARKILADLYKRDEVSYVSPYNFAMIHNGLSEKEKTLDCLQKARTERDLLISVLSVDTRFNNLHGDSRFEELRR